MPVSSLIRTDRLAISSDTCGLFAVAASVQRTGRVTVSLTPSRRSSISPAVSVMASAPESSARRRLSTR
jgi:hypothetical protein